MSLYQCLIQNPANLIDHHSGRPAVLFAETAPDIFRERPLPVLKFHFINRDILRAGADAFTYS